MAQTDNQPAQDEVKTDTRTPWIIGVLALILVAFATYLNYGDEWFHPKPTDVSATVAPSASEK
jgi:hypothetical protein